MEETYMCGFAGFTGYLENGEEVLTNMMNKIIHRGPDSAGQHIDEKLTLDFADSVSSIWTTVISRCTTRRMTW